jgi:hypothetical protein
MGAFAATATSVDGTTPLHFACFNLHNDLVVALRSRDTSAEVRLLLLRFVATSTLLLRRGGLGLRAGVSDWFDGTPEVPLWWALSLAATDAPAMHGRSDDGGSARPRTSGAPNGGGWREELAGAVAAVCREDAWARRRPLLATRQRGAVREAAGSHAYVGTVQCGQRSR